MGVLKNEAVGLISGAVADQRPATAAAVENTAPPARNAHDVPRRGPIPLEWLDLKALTQYISVSRRTLTEWLYRQENPLPGYRIDGKVYVRRGDFDSWMEAHPVEGPVNLGKIVDDVMADLQEID